MYKQIIALCLPLCIITGDRIHQHNQKLNYAMKLYDEIIAEQKELNMLLEERNNRIKRLEELLGETQKNGAQSGEKSALHKRYFCTIM